ncbi:MAG: sulfotransferase [Elainella sp. Prado103]|jgi:hypothetical protein|nr:sulfotransferase [Elainella sp. Prado103]
MVMPNFLIIGAAKAGTTSLSHYLSQHPQIYMSARKEPKFFAFEGEQVNPLDPANARSITDLSVYKQLFAGVKQEIAIGEVSPIYLTSMKAPYRIHHHIPDAKLIAVLRNPVDRAYSHFVHMIQKEVEPLTDFIQALDQPEHEINGFIRKRPYIDFGFYTVQLQRYFDLFPATQLKVCLYDDLQRDSIKFLQDIFQFLQVDDTFVPANLFKYNASGIPKNRMLNRWLTSKANPWRALAKSLCPVWVRQSLVKKVQQQNYVQTAMPIAARQQLIALYREDVLKLQDLIDRDLSMWLNSPV